MREGQGRRVRRSWGILHRKTRYERERIAPPRAAALGNSAWENTLCARNKAAARAAALGNSARGNICARDKTATRAAALSHSMRESKIRARGKAAARAAALSHSARENTMRARGKAAASAFEAFCVEKHAMREGQGRRLRP